MPFHDYSFVPVRHPQPSVKPSGPESAKAPSANATPFSALSGRAASAAAVAGRVSHAARGLLTSVKALFNRIAAALPTFARVSRSSTSSELDESNETTPLLTPKSIKTQEQVREEIDARANAGAGQILARADQAASLEIDGIFSKGVREARGGSKNASERIRHALENTTRCLNDLDSKGLTHFGPEGSKSFAARLVARQLARLPEADRDVLVKAANPKSLNELAGASVDPGETSPLVARGIADARNEIARRDAKLTDDFVLKGNALAANMASTIAGGELDERSFLNSLFAASDVFLNLKSHCDSTGKSLPEDAKALQGHLYEQLQAWLKVGTAGRSSPLPALQTLNGKELERARRALEQFGVQPPEPLLRSLEAVRLPSLEAKFREGVRSMFAGIAGGRPEDALAGCRNMHESFIELTETRHALKRDMQGADQVRGVRDELMKEVIAQLPNGEAVALAEALQKPSTRALLKGMVNVGILARASGQEAAGDPLSAHNSLAEMAARLEESLDLVAAEIKARRITDVRLDPDALKLRGDDEHIRPGEMTPPIRAALTKLFGVAWTHDDRPRFYPARNKA